MIEIINHHSSNELISRTHLEIEHEVLIFCDSIVRNLYGHSIAEQLDARIIILPVGEACKSFRTIKFILKNFQKIRVDKSTTIIALGGGAIIDTVGFACSIYLRGLPLIYLPTTIVAMVDASIGAKNAINTSHGKNLIGTFYEPKKILMDFAWIKTLSQKDQFNGMAEIFKLNLVYDQNVMSDRLIIHDAPKLFQEEPQFLTQNPLISYQTIISAIHKKLLIVCQDPTEQGIRRILNFGHTIGHALERATDFQLSHGQAVAIGCFAEAHLWMNLKLLPEKIFRQIESLDFSFSLKLPKNYQRSLVTKAMMHDKKNQNQQIHFVPIDRMGHAVPHEGSYSRPVPIKNLEPTLQWMEERYG